jgi:hypothetical protein
MKVRLDSFPTRNGFETHDDTISSFFRSSERRQTSDMANIWAIDAEPVRQSGFGGCEWNAEGTLVTEASSSTLTFKQSC